MKVKQMWMAAFAVVGFGGYALLATAQQHEHKMSAPAISPRDARQLVKFPELMRVHTIADMRDHLLALQEIDMALSENDFDKAANVAEGRLGMSSLELHDAAHIAPYMPQGMQDIGTQMHHAASRFERFFIWPSVASRAQVSLADRDSVFLTLCVQNHQRRYAILYLGGAGNADE